MSKTPVVLYGFWASSCSWRVRAGLRQKGIDFEDVSIDIVSRHQHRTPVYKMLNPAQKVPTLKIDGVTLVESMAMLQYLEDTHPQPSLLPDTPLLRAYMREIVETIVSGIQPLQNIGLRRQFDSDEDHQRFGRFYTKIGLETVESLLKKSSGKFCVGAGLSVADLCLVPQVYDAVGCYKIALDEFPLITKIYEALLKEKIFIESHPKNFKKITE